MSDQSALRLTASDAIALARNVAAVAAERADAQDHDCGFPSEDVRDLAKTGLLSAPVPCADGGVGLGNEAGAFALLQVLRLIGYGSLALGRIYEGHVNALQLIARYGDEAQRRHWFADAAAGHLFGVWNTEPADGGTTLTEIDGGYALAGVKTFASGAGYVTRALITARRTPGDPPLMLVVPLETGTRSDLSAWRAHGMRASATGTLDFSGLIVGKDALLGGPDDYHRQPFFSGGAPERDRTRGLRWPRSPHDRSADREPR